MSSADRRRLGRGAVIAAPLLGRVERYQRHRNGGTCAHRIPPRSGCASTVGAFRADSRARNSAGTSAAGGLSQPRPCGLLGILSTMRAVERGERRALSIGHSAPPLCTVRSMPKYPARSTNKREWNTAHYRN